MPHKAEQLLQGMELQKKRKKTKMKSKWKGDYKETKTTRAH